MQLPRNIDDYVGPVKERSPEEITSQIKLEIAEFIGNTVTKETAPTLLILERKARHLFQPFMGRLMEKGYSLTSLRRLKEALWIKGRLPEHVGLLTDCINSGEEIMAVNEYLKSRKCNVKRIYSYASNKSGLAHLNTKGAIAKSPITSVHEFADAEFDDFFKTLQVYYQSRLEPMDVDHSYDLYRVSAAREPPEFEKIVERSCQKAFENRRIRLEADVALHLPKNIKSFTIDLGSMDQIKNAGLVEQIKPVRNLVEFESLQLRSKVQYEDKGLEFSMTGCCIPLNVDLGLFKNKKECDIGKLTPCYLDSINSKMGRYKTSTIVCPLCVEHCVDRAILDRFHQVFSLLGGDASREKFGPIGRE